MKWTSTRSDQNWVLDNFLKLSENEDTLHPGILAQRLERGYKYSDLQEVYSKIIGRRSYSKSWAKQGHKLSLLAKQAKSSHSRAEFYHRAAMCYGRAQHTIKGKDHPQKIEYYHQMGVCWKLFEENHKSIRTVEGPNHSYVVMEQKKDAPVVVVIPGMDQFKEEVLFPYNNPWFNRGFTVVVMEGPGHVSQLMKGNYIDVDNMSDAVAEVVKSLNLTEKIVMFGMSFGTRWVIEAAARIGHPKIAACIGQMANVGSSKIIFEQAQPNFRRIFMEMANIQDEDKFDKYCDKIDKQLVKRAKQINIPYLMVAGEMDELCPPEQTIGFLQENIPHGEIWMYEDCFHVMGEVCSNIYGPIADWARQVVDGHWKPKEETITWIMN